MAPVEDGESERASEIGTQRALIGALMMMIIYPSLIFSLLPFQMDGDGWRRNNKD